MSPAHSGDHQVIKIPLKTWVTKAKTEHEIVLQKQIITFLLWAYGGLLTASVTIFVLQGFAVGGFKLSETVLMFIGGATLGEIGGLLALTFHSVFKK